MGHSYERDLQHARNEFSSSKEADRMLRELRKAAAYCTGPVSSVQHGNRIAAVEQARDELRARGK